MKNKIMTIFKKIKEKIKNYIQNFSFNDTINSIKTKYKAMNKKTKIVFILVIISFVPLLFGISTFSRYVIEKIYYNYLLSRQFYFNSYVLTGDSYSVHDWNGINDYIFSVDIENFMDELRWTHENISYEVSVECTPTIASSVTCNANNGVLNYSATGGSAMDVNITLSNNNPNNYIFTSSDYVDINVVVTSTSPYRKSLSATFRVNANPQNVSYTITDAVNQNYFDFVISNNTTGIKNISLTWDYTLVSIDNLNEYVRNGTFSNTTVNGISHVRGVTFNLESKVATSIKFYKTNTTQNYTYPITNLNSIIAVTEN